MMLTVELKQQKDNLVEEVAICCDQEGLDFLINELQELSGKKGHSHLMTPSWAGSELTEVKQGGDAYHLVNHLRIVKA